MANYTKTTWVNDTAPAINETNLNNMEDGIYNAQSDSVILYDLAANKPASSATNIGHIYIETDSPYKIWRDNGGSWDNVAFAAAAGDDSIGFHDLSITVDDPSEYGFFWYGDKKTITLDPNAAANALHYGTWIQVNTDSGNAQNMWAAYGLNVDTNHYGSGQMVYGAYGIRASLGNYGTINTHGIGMDFYAYNAGTASADFRCARMYMVNEGPGSTPTYVGSILEADGIMGKITNSEQGQITRAYVLVSDMENQDVGSTVGTFLGSIFRFDNEGTITTANYGFYESPVDTGSITNWAALYLEDQSGIGTGTNHLMYCEAGGVGNDICWIDTNLYRSAANVLKTDDSFHAAVLVATGDGAVGAPAFAFISDTDTGVYLSAANEVTLVGGGAAVLTANGTQALIRDGAVGTPALSFINDPNTGLYRIGADQLGFATAGTLALEIDASQKLWLTDANLYRSAANVLKTDDEFHAASHINVGGRLDFLDSNRQIIRSGRDLHIIASGTNRDIVINAVDSTIIQSNSVEIMRVDVTGRVGIGATSPATLLHIDQSSTTVALPTTTLDQADVDEPFIKFIGTGAAADLTRSIVDDGDVTTATLVGWAKMEVEDVGNQIADQDYFMPLYTLV